MNLALPHVTVAVATYRRARLLAQTLQGLTRQDYPAELYELLVLDNNSPDDTRAVVASFAGAPHPPKHMLETQQGANFARNRALAEAAGDIIAYADDDIIVADDWLARLVEPFANDQAHRIGAVGGEVIPEFPDGCPDWVRSFHGPLAMRPDAGPVSPRQIPMSANLAFRRDALRRAGGWDTKVGRMGGRIFGGDENGPISRIRRAGLEVWFAPAAKVRHQMPAGRTTLRYVMRHAFDSACSRTIGHVSLARETGRNPTGWLLTRWPLNLLKAPLFALLALLNFILLRPGAGKKALVRAWRSCGYLYQIPRILCGRLN